MCVNANSLADHTSGQRGRGEVVRGPDAGARSASFRAGPAANRLGGELKPKPDRFYCQLKSIISILYDVNNLLSTSYNSRGAVIKPARFRVGMRIFCELVAMFVLLGVGARLDWGTS